MRKKKKLKKKKKTGKGYLAAAGGGAIYGFSKGILGGGGSIKLSMNSVLNEIGKRSIKWGNGTAVESKKEKKKKNLMKNYFSFDVSRN